MHIKPSSARKKAYPTLTCVAAGAIVLAGSSCQQHAPGSVPNANIIEEPIMLGGSVPHPTPPGEKSPEKTAKLPRREAQAVVGRARLDKQTGEIIQPSAKQNTSTPHEN